MAVPCGDERDHKFAKHFGLEITNIIGSNYNGEEANDTKDAILENSDFLNGMVMKDAIDVVINKLEEIGIGKRRVNYKMRDAAFSRQRYWGEPFPIIWKAGIAYPLDENELPLELPYVESYKPGPEGEGPLANIPGWAQPNDLSPALAGGVRETNTMPGYAGSSWYFLRYMDPGNNKEFCDRKASDYWGQVDLYIGGTEHAVGHLLYSRMWTKFLYDLNLIGHDEPYKRLVNQGMIQGVSEKICNSAISFRYLKNRFGMDKIFIPIGEGYELDVYDPEEDGPVLKPTDILHQKRYNLESYFLDEKGWANTIEYRVDVNDVDGHVLNIKAFLNSNRGKQFQNAVFLCEGGFWFQNKFHRKNNGSDKFFTEPEVEKMSKSKFNVVNPDDLVYKYGADTFRMYEMFLGPVEMSKPWDTKGIEGVFRFLKKFWRLFKDEEKPGGNDWLVTDEQPTNEELKVLHKTIKKIEEDTERFSFNTGVSAFMIATNELTDLKCHKRSILEPLVILLAPYAPHIAEELYQQLRKPPQTPPKEGLANAQGKLADNTLVKENIKLSVGSKVLPPGEDLGGVSVTDAIFPKFEEKYVKESSKTYPVAINGKTRTELTIALDATQQQVEEIVLANEVVKKWMEGKPAKKVIYVKGKMINVVS